MHKIFTLGHEKSTNINAASASFDGNHRYIALNRILMFHSNDSNVCEKYDCKT